MLVSRVGIKLDEGHLLLKLAVFTVGTKRKTVSRVTLTSLQLNIPPPLATGIENFTANSNDSRVQLQLSEHSSTDIRMCLPALCSSDYQGWTVLVKVRGHTCETTRFSSHSLTFGSLAASPSPAPLHVYFLFSEQCKDS